MFCPVSPTRLSKRLSGFSTQKRDLQPQLSEGAVKFLEKHTNRRAQEIREEHENFLKAYPSGKISSKQFEKMVSTMFKDSSDQGDQVKKLSKHIMRAFERDQTRDQNIDFQEFLVILFVMTEGSPTEILKQIFQVFDIDGDGYIKQNEMDKLVKALYCLLSEEERESKSPKELSSFMFSEMDANDDNKVTFEEYTKALESDKKISKLFTLKIVEIIDGAL